MRSRGIGVCVAISSAANSDTAITRSRPFRRRREPAGGGTDRPRRVVASGIVIGAASCTVTTSGTPFERRDRGRRRVHEIDRRHPSRGTAAAELVPRVVEHGPRERQHDGVDVDEPVGRERRVDRRSRMPSGERGDVHARRAGREQAHERRGVPADPAGCRLKELFDVHGDPHSPRTLP